jgi:hypothetical protein
MHGWSRSRGVTIQIPDVGPPFDAELTEDQSNMLWLHQTNTRGQRMGGRSLLSAALTLGCRVVRASPEEQALLRRTGW